MMTPVPPRAGPPVWFWVIAALGLAWNIHGVLQFSRTAFAADQELIRSGMTAAQAALYAGLPVGMPVALAAGVFGGVAGCVLLLLRDRLAVPVFAVSVAGYIVLDAGDITQGAFAAFGTGQVVILTLVVLIAVGLLAGARHLVRAGVLA